MNKLFIEEVNNEIKQYTYYLGKLLKDTRKKRGITIRGLQELSGTSTTVISDFENYEYLPSLYILHKTFKALGINILGEEFKCNKNVDAVENYLMGLGLSNKSAKEVKSFIEFKIQEGKR